VRVQVERIPAKTRPPKVLWLWWAGPGTPDLDLVWRAYIRSKPKKKAATTAKAA
jgi:hypothetical protein